MQGQSQRTSMVRGVPTHRIGPHFAGQAQLYTSNGLDVCNMSGWL